MTSKGRPPRDPQIPDIARAHAPQSLIVCPCCLGGLTPPPLFVSVSDGNRYCARCEWIFAGELLDRGDLAIDPGDGLKCPTHGEASKWVNR
jgi:hypothetical protein